MALRSRFEDRFWLLIRFRIRRLSSLFSFASKEGILPRFLSHYAAEGVTPVPAAERESFPDFQKCQVCSYCTFTCAAVRDGMAPPAFEPKYLLVGLGRTLNETELAESDWIPCAQCAGCTVECPVGVPIHEMAEAIVERGQRLLVPAKRPEEPPKE